MDEQMNNTVQTETHAVELADAQSVQAAIEMGTGALNIRPHEVGLEATTLLNAAFVYNIPEWQPEVTYNVEAACGQLKVKQPRTESKLPHKQAKYEWDLQFNEAVPLDLNVKVGLGKASLDLGNLNLTRLKTAVGSGKLEANLIGDMPELSKVKLATGSGKTALMMHGSYDELKDIAVHTASGQLDLALDGNYPALGRLTVQSASGRMQVSLKGNYAAMQSLKVETASGKVDVDLNGVWATDVQIRVNCVAGNICIRLPENVGVAAKVTKLTGQVHAPALHRQGKLYVNAAYGQSEVTLHLEISTVSGVIRLERG